MHIRVQDCLNKMIARCAFVRAAPHGGGEGGGGFARPTREDALAATSVEQLTWWDGSDIDATAVPLDCPPALIFDWEWPDGCVPFYQVACVRARAYACMHMHPSVHLSIYLSVRLSI